MTDVPQHLTSYPVVSDGIETFRSNPYGAKSIEVADGAYTRFGKPLTPYLRTPYNLAEPYIQKADSLADSGLQSVDQHFPIVKQDTHAVVDTAKSYAVWPLHLAGDGYGYLMRTWDDEYQKTVRRDNRGPGLTSSVMAIVSAEMKIVGDVLQALADYLAPKKEQAKHKKDAFFDQTARQRDSYATAAKRTANDYSAKAQEKVN